MCSNENTHTLPYRVSVIHTGLFNGGINVPCHLGLQTQVHAQLIEHIPTEHNMLDNQSHATVIMHIVINMQSWIRF